VPGRHGVGSGGRHAPPLPRHLVVLATGGYGRAYFSATSAHTLHGGRQCDDPARRAAAAGYGVRAFPPDRHLRAGCLITEGAPARGGISPTRRASASWSAMHPTPRISPRANVVSRSMTIEIREGRGCGPQKDHILLHLEHLDRSCCMSACRAFPRRPRSSPASTSPRSRSGAADGALQYGRHPDQLITPK